MASPTVVTTNTSAVATAATSHTINLPGSLVSGNLILLKISEAAPGASSTFTIPDFTEITAAHAINGTVVAERTFYKISDGTEGASVTGTSSVSEKSAHTAYQINGGDTPYSGTGATGSGAANAANPPNVSVVSGPKDILVVASMSQDGETYTGGAAPTNYTNLLTNNSGAGGATTVNCWIQTAQRALTAASSEDPGVFSHTATVGWCAQTIIIPELVVVPAFLLGEPARRLRRARLTI
jgi:hypothetical protein